MSDQATPPVIPSTSLGAILFVAVVYEITPCAGNRVSTGCRWSSSRIPYEMSADVAADARLVSAIEKGMKTWEEKTCVRFVAGKGDEKEVLWIEKHTATCDANVGTCSMETDAARGRRFNRLSVGKCILTEPRWIVHELGHVLGLIHQHMRPDRDSHVNIVWPSIRSPTFLRNFRRLERYPTLGVAYDLFSIMHYSPSAFAKKGATTIELPVARDGEEADRTGWGDGEGEIKAKIDGEASEDAATGGGREDVKRNRVRVESNVEDDRIVDDPTRKYFSSTEASCLQRRLGRALRPSFYDVLFVNRLYECDSGCAADDDDATSSESPPSSSSEPSASSSDRDHSDCYWGPGCRRLCPERWRDRICKSNFGPAAKADIDEIGKAETTDGKGSEGAESPAEDGVDGVRIASRDFEKEPNSGEATPSGMAPRFGPASPTWFIPFVYLCIARGLLKS